MPRPRKPVETHIANGTYRPDRHGPRPAPTGGTTPAAPADLTGEARRLWDHLTAKLAGVVREVDQLALGECCRWWAELVRIRAKLASVEPGDKQYHALVVEAGICSDKVDRACSQFGLNPAARAKLHLEMAEVETLEKHRAREMSDYFIGDGKRPEWMGPMTLGKSG